MRLPLLFVLLSLCVTACIPKPSDFRKDDEATSSSSGPVVNEKQTASLVLDALMEKDMTALSPLMHAKKGTRFTASTHVRTQADDYTPADVILFADAIEDDFASDKSRTWGIEDGSGNPIDLTVAQYVDKYVADHDFRTATDVRWNHVQDRGNTIDNAASAYPNAQIVEYHFPGFDPQYGGMDWASLRLVLEQDATTKAWSLVGVIHDHWTP